MTTNGDVLIRVENLQKAFGDFHALNGITEEIHKGEVVVIIGPSGSGKSTFLRSLNLLEVPTGGLTTSAYSRTPHGAGHRNKPRNRGCTPVPHTRFRRERRPVRLFSQKTGPNPPPPPRTDCGRVRTVLHARSLQRTHGTAPPAAAAANRQFPARIRETNSSNTPYLIL